MIRRVIAAAEKSVLRVLRVQHRFPPLFITGAPRSGTTLVYLHIFNRYHFSYFPNISTTHPNAPLAWALWGKARYRHTAGYQNTYGVTPGPLGPSDGWAIFHRWFPEYDYARPAREERLYELRTLVRGFETAFGAPFINKNNSNSVRISYLSTLFPDALFVHVTRESTSAALSLLAGRKKHNIPLNQWWAVAPPQFYKRHFATEIEQVVYQQVGVDAFARQALARLPAERYRVVRYESFCEEPGALLTWIARHYARAGVPLSPRQETVPAVFQPVTRAPTPEQAREIAEATRRARAEVAMAGTG